MKASEVLRNHIVEQLLLKNGWEVGRSSPDNFFKPNKEIVIRGDGS